MAEFDGCRIYANDAKSLQKKAIPVEGIAFLIL